MPRMSGPITQISQALRGCVCTGRNTQEPPQTAKKLGKRDLYHNRAVRLPRLAPALSKGVGRTNHEGPGPLYSDAVENRQKRNNPPTPKSPKRKTIERSGDANISYPWPRLAIHPCYVGPAVLTR